MVGAIHESPLQTICVPLNCELLYPRTAFPKKSAPENESASTKNHLPNMEPKKRLNHTEWLRLTKEGENICAILRQQDYQCRKQTHRLTWKIGKEDNSYALTWLPAPV